MKAKRWSIVETALLTMLVGCRAQPQVKEQPNWRVQSNNTRASSRPARGAANRTIIDNKSSAGFIRRAALEDLVGRGAADFFRNIRVRAVHQAGRFLGWQILLYSGPGRLYPGDIVTHVNGRRIKRPRDFMAVWEHLASDASFRIRMIRQGQVLSKTIPIYD